MEALERAIEEADAAQQQAVRPWGSGRGGACGWTAGRWRGCEGGGAAQERARMDRQGLEHELQRRASESEELQQRIAGAEEGAQLPVITPLPSHGAQPRPGMRPRHAAQGMRSCFRSRGRNRSLDGEDVCSVAEGLFSPTETGAALDSY